MLNLNAYRRNKSACCYQWMVASDHGFNLRRQDFGFGRELGESIRDS